MKKQQHIPPHLAKALDIKSKGPYRRIVDGKLICTSKAEADRAKREGFKVAPEWESAAERWNDGKPITPESEIFAPMIANMVRNNMEDEQRNNYFNSLFDYESDNLLMDPIALNMPFLQGYNRAPRTCDHLRNSGIQRSFIDPPVRRTGHLRPFTETTFPRPEPPRQHLIKPTAPPLEYKPSVPHAEDQEKADLDRALRESEYTAILSESIRTAKQEEEERRQKKFFKVKTLENEDEWIELAKKRSLEDMQHKKLANFCEHCKYHYSSSDAKFCANCGEPRSSI